MPASKLTPDHSTISRTRRLIDLETLQAVFTWVLDLARLDRKRMKKGSNDDWYNPNDPDAKITKMKNGRTHLAHKEEHAVDLDTGAVVAVTLVPASAGDTATIEGTLDAAVQNLDDAREIAGDESQRKGDPEEAVADKGYHSKMVLLSLQQEGRRTYIAEPQRGRQNGPGSRPSAPRCTRIVDARTGAVASR